MPDPARYSALIYTSISLAIAVIFLLATFTTGFFYPPVARLGGAVWVFILSMIITMPLVIPYVKKKRKI
ncbi:MAG: hypothetical protein C4589_01945 [Peptococcaceae bacterium]|jgi:hypothetical protein|nr:MAG: hypothetical protein C4589_01945 [Peptococcaceae bacterium]